VATTTKQRRRAAQVARGKNGSNQRVAAEFPAGSLEAELSDIGRQCLIESGQNSPPATSQTSITTSTAHRKKVRLVFADTLYWGAALHPHDPYRAQLIRARQALGEVRMVSTDEVLTELLDGLAPPGAYLREAAALAVRRILNDRRPPLRAPGT